MTAKPNKPPAACGPATAPRKPDPYRTLSRDEEDFLLQLLASAMGLPRLCVFKACRRRKRCIGPDTVCIAHHRGLVHKRWRAAVKVIAVPGR